MHRVLLCIEDYNELTFLETMLKKLGFDVLSIRNETPLSEKLLGFAPELVIATGDGAKIRAGSVSKKVKKKGITSKLILLLSRTKIRDNAFIKQQNCDAVVEIPINPKNIIGAMSECLGLDSSVILKKFEKLALAREASNRPEESNFVKGKPTKESNTIIIGNIPSAEENKVRVLGYKKFLDKPEPSKVNHFSKDKVKEALDDMRKWANEQEDLEDLEEERKNFVKALFKK